MYFENWELMWQKNNHLRNNMDLMYDFEIVSFTHGTEFSHPCRDAFLYHTVGNRQQLLREEKYLRNNEELKEKEECYYTQNF